MEPSSDILLYHGTSTEHLEQILRDGLLPRLSTNRQSNYEGQVESKPEFVYLSDAYPVFFAANAAEDGHDPVVFKVEVSASSLFPDEDFIAFQRSVQLGTDLESEIESIDPAQYQKFWKESLQLNGNVATRRVAPESIAAHRVIPFEGNADLLMAIGMDSAPTQINYAIHGEHYRRCIAALFQHELPDLSTAIRQISEETMGIFFGEDVLPDDD